MPPRQPSQDIAALKVFYALRCERERARLRGEYERLRCELRQLAQPRYVAATAAGLTEHELTVLRVVAGERLPGFCWGASVSACLEWLQGHGLVDRELPAGITPLGRAVLRECYARAGCALFPLEPRPGG